MARGRIGTRRLAGRVQARHMTAIRVLVVGFGVTADAAGCDPRGDVSVIAPVPLPANRAGRLVDRHVF